MSLWGIASANAANSPKFGTELVAGPVGSGNAAKAANNTSLYANTTNVSGRIAGQFSVSPANMANTVGESKKVTHAGWVLRRGGTGPVASVTVTGAGTGYSNTDLVRVSGGSVNAAGSVLTNGAGAIQSITITNPGSGFVSTGTVAVTNSTAGTTAGSGATLVAVLGGRAGRVDYETVVAGGANPSSNIASILPS